MAPVLAFLFGWGNAPFAIAAGVVVVFTLLQITGILGLIAGSEGHDHDTDVDADADANLDHDVDHDADDAHGDDNDASARASLGSILGFGTLPMSMIWQTFALAAAAAGYALNAAYLGRPDGPPLVTLLWTLPASTFAGGAAVSLLARALGPVFSSKAQEATRRDELVGQTGVVISSRVNEEFGEVRIRDKTGHDIRVVCKLAKGARTVPAERQRVLVVDCDERGSLLVEPYDDGDDGDATRPEAAKTSI